MHSNPASCHYDGPCRVMRGQQLAMRSCHVTLRGDALWLGEKWAMGDEVIALGFTTTVAADGMLLINSQDGEVLARIFPDDDSTANTWAANLQEAGKIVGAVNRKEILEREARRLAQKQRARKAARLANACFKWGSSMLGKQPTATEIWMQWQLSSDTRKPEAEEEDLQDADTVLIFRRTKFQTKPELRKVKICGDVLFISHLDGQAEEPLLLTGATIYLHGSTVSVWSEEVLRVRMFFDDPEDPERWSELLRRAVSLIANVKTGNLAANAKPPTRCPSTTSLDVISPRPQTQVQGAHKDFGRARRYETPLKQVPTAAPAEDKLLGA